MSGDNGFTYPAALLLIVVTSVALMGATTYWSTLLQREREKALLFNGLQIQNAIAAYYAAGPGGTYPRRLADLLMDPRSGGRQRHLRRIYPDPMTADGRWQLIRDGRGGIRGVVSRSRKHPIKQDRFPAPLADFKHRRRYSDWRFVYEP